MRETGPVRKALSGDEAAPYLGVARTFLGQLKNRMASGELAQGAMTRQLPDGTTIRVESRFGQDKIAITRPTPEPGKPRQPTEENVEPTQDEPPPYVPGYDDTAAEGMAVLCNCTTEDGPFDIRPYLWRPGRRGITEVTTPGTSAIGMGLSANGEVVVGFYYLDGHDHAFRWTALGGCETLPALFSGAASRMIATDCNWDGSVVVGTGLESLVGSSVNWVWTRAAGTAKLPGSYWQENQIWGNPRISPNGKYIAGSTPTYTTEYYYQGHGPNPVTIEQTTATVPGGMVWTRQPGGGYGAGVPMPMSGLTYTTHMSYFGTLNFSYVNDFRCTPTGVANNGVVVGGAGGAGFRWHGAAVQILTDPAAGGAYATAVTPDGGRVAGLDAWSTAWVYTASTRQLVRFGGQIYDMAPNGTKYVGGMGDVFSPYHFQLKARTPVLWQAGGPAALPMLEGTARGWAEAIAMPRIDLSTDPQVAPSISV